MKKFVSIALTAALSVGLLAGCGNGGDAANNADANAEADKVITVAASPSPHAEILKVARRSTGCRRLYFRSNRIY